MNAARRLRVAYVVYGSPSDRNGVPEKVRAAALALQKLADVELVWVTSTLGSLGPGALASGEDLIGPPPSYIGRVLASRSSGSSLVLRLRERLSAFSPDIIYLRHPLYRPGLARTLRSVAPYVMEINGDPYPELMLRRRQVVGVLDRVLGGSLFRLASGFVGVTEESAEYAVSRAGEKPSVVIGNGVDCDSVQLLHHDNRGFPVHLAYLGSPSVYNGLDRLWSPIHASTDSARGICIHIIGPGWSADSIARRAGSKVEVKCYGYLRPEELADVLTGVDVGIGPLGVHRRGLREASSLKIRRYLAHGIPVVSASKDPDLDASLPFVLRVASDDRPIDLDVLTRFALNARKRRIREEARRYAEERLCYDAKAAQLMRFMMEVLGQEHMG